MVDINAVAKNAIGIIQALYTKKITAKDNKKEIILDLNNKWLTKRKEHIGIEEEL